MQKSKMAAKNGMRTGAKAKISFSCTISVINTYLYFTQKFKMAMKNGETNYFFMSDSATAL